MAVAAPLALARSARRLAKAAPHLGESPLDARRRVLGAPWVDAMEEIRRRIPTGEPYVLINAQPVEEGAYYWARYDLAPRRAVYFGHLKNLPGPQRLRERLARSPRWIVVVTGSGQPPRLLTHDELLEELTARQRRRAGEKKRLSGEGVRIRAAVLEPVGAVHRRSHVPRLSGWRQDRTARSAAPPSLVMTPAPVHAAPAGCGPVKRLQVKG